MNRKHSYSYSKSTILLTIIVFLSMIVSFGKEIIFAAYFGTSSEADAFSVATQIPVSLFSLVSVSITNVVIPLYSKAYEKQGQSEANKFYSILTTMINTLTILVTIIFIIFSPFFIDVFSPGLDEQTKSIASNILRITMCISIFSCYTQINSGVLNYNKVFSTTRLLSNLRNIFGILFLISLYNSLGIYAMAIGLVVGIILESIISFFMTKRFVKYKPMITFKNEFIKESFKIILPILIGTSACEICNMINQVIASYMDSGSLAIINYSNRIITTISTLTISSIETIVYPSFSKEFNNGNKDALKKLFSNSFMSILILSLPITIGGMILSREIINAVFQRGNFTDADSLNVASVFFLSLPGFLFLSVRSLIAKLYYATGNTHVPMVSAVINIIASVAINALLIFALKCDFKAFGISSSISAFISMIFIYLKARKDFKIKLYGGFNDCFKIFMSIILMVSFLLGFRNMIDAYNIHSIFKTVIIIITSGVIYFISLFMFKIKIIDDIIYKKI